MKDIASVLAGCILNNKKKLNKIFNSTLPATIITLKAKKNTFKITVEKL
jgi:hypothetical protein